MSGLLRGLALASLLLVSACATQRPAPPPCHTDAGSAPDADARSSASADLPTPRRQGFARSRRSR